MSSKEIVVDIKSDAAPLHELVNKLQRSMDKHPEISEALNKLFSLPDFGKKLVRLDSDYGSAGTGELLVTLNPSDCFRSIAAAVATGDIDALVVEHERFLSEVQLSSEHNGKGKGGVTGQESS